MTVDEIAKRLANEPKVLSLVIYRMAEDGVKMKDEIDRRQRLLRRIRADIEARADARMSTSVDLGDSLYQELCRVAQEVG